MNHKISPRTIPTLAAAVGLSVAAAVVGLASVTPASAGGDMGGHVMVGPTGNKVEMVEPSKSKYVPHPARASTRDRAKAENLLADVRDFCRTHSARDIKDRWRAGGGTPAKSTHFFNPRPSKRSSGLHPARPRAALIYDGRLRGVMFVGKPLPYLGSIPRAHGHHMDMAVEMVHVYCTRNLKDAFTPNRALGINADLIDLRWKIRPAVMDLSERQLRAVRDKIRGYIGNKYATAPAETSGSSGPDPVLQAMRTEIRQSVWDLTEAQLRSVWRLMKSY
jgi:hypothetical protein